MSHFINIIFNKLASLDIFFLILRTTLWIGDISIFIGEERKLRELREAPKHNLIGGRAVFEPGSMWFAHYIILPLYK